MNFKTPEEKLEWLKSAGAKIKQMEADLPKAVMAKEFEKAFSLRKGIQFAKREFAKVSKTLKKGFEKNGRLV